MALKIFVDFDGTVTKQDVGNAFFETFGGPGYRDTLKEYESAAISAQETFRRGIRAIGSARTSEIDEFLRRQAIDESFIEFCEFCRENGIEFHIVSDGLDLYIRKILEFHGALGVSFFSNGVKVLPEDGDRCSLEIQFPYSDAECTRCACCKRNIILTRTGEDDIIAYVGEGYSDRCAAQYADIVFAKDSLQSFCQRENISYFPYSSFHDVVGRLKGLLTKKLRKRRRAELMRRSAFICE
jgi:2,3-diketo-5-methylthio-1-phosphopentane phosphatase